MQGLGRDEDKHRRGMLLGFMSLLLAVSPCEGMAGEENQSETHAEYIKDPPGDILL